MRSKEDMRIPVMGSQRVKGAELGKEHEDEDEGESRMQEGEKMVVEEREGLATRQRQIAHVMPFG